MKNLRDLRTRKGLTQLALATLMNVDVSTVTKWENGNSYPRAETLPVLAKALGCTIDALFNAEEKEAG